MKLVPETASVRLQRPVTQGGTGGLPTSGIGGPRIHWWASHQCHPDRDVARIFYFHKGHQNVDAIIHITQKEVLREVHRQKSSFLIGKWAFAFALLPAFTLVWSVVELRPLVSRPSEQLGTLERSMDKMAETVAGMERSIDRIGDIAKRLESLERTSEKLAQSVAGLERSIDRVGDVAKRLERIENLMMRTVPPKPEK